MYRIIYTLALIVILLTGCRKDDIITPPEEEEPEMKGFAIYFLEDDNLKISQILDKPLDSLKLKKVPWIKEADIEMFDFSGQCIYLKKDRTEFFPPHTPLHSFPGVWYDRPYIVTLNKERLFMGYTRSEANSNLYYVPVIEALYFYNLPVDIVTIGFNQHSFLSYNLYQKCGSDISYSDEIKNKILESTIFREGISLEIVNVKIIRTDTIIFEYLFKITNNDNDNLYIIDTEKFNTYTTSRQIISIYYPYESNKQLKHYKNYLLIDNIDKIEAGEEKTIKENLSYDKNVYSEGWDPSWFVKLESGKSLIFKIRTEKPKTLELNKYYVRFCYYAPFPIERSERTLSDGRYWLGTAISDITEVIVLPNDSCVITRYK